MTCGGADSANMAASPFAGGDKKVDSRGEQLKDRKRERKGISTVLELAETGDQSQIEVVFIL